MAEEVIGVKVFERAKESGGQRRPCKIMGKTLTLQSLKGKLPTGSKMPPPAAINTSSNGRAVGKKT